MTGVQTCALPIWVKVRVMRLMMPDQAHDDMAAGAGSGAGSGAGGRPGLTVWSN